MSRSEIQCSIIRDPPPEVFERCLDVLTESFRDYYFFHKLQQRDATNVDNLRHHLTTRLIPSFKGEAQLWVARRGSDGPIEAVSVVTFPGKHMLDLPTFKELNPGLIARYTEDHQAWIKEAMAGFWESYKATPALIEPLEKDYEVVLIGTHPEAQRQGFGNALLTAIADQAFKEGTGVFLMTQSHERAKAYVKAGYKELDLTEIKFADGDTTPHYAFERRP